jgi:hypothetical protein
MAPSVAREGAVRGVAGTFSDPDTQGDRNRRADVDVPKREDYAKDMYPDTQRRSSEDADSPEASSSVELRDLESHSASSGKNLQTGLHVTGKHLDKTYIRPNYWGSADISSRWRPDGVE